ncbi:MAG: hypothetical protein ACLFWM_08195 [Actinomycetota bacterium]
MNTQMTGKVRMADDTAGAVTVQIHLGDETLTLLAAGGTEIGTWPLDEVGISSRPDGFHLRIEGEEVILTTDDDARFALELGITTPTNRLARMMAKLRDETSAGEVMVDLTEESEGISYHEPETPVVSRRESRMSNGLPYLGALVVGASVVAFLASVVALAGGRAISFPGDIPAWPAMLGASLILAAGGFSAFNTHGKGRVSIGIGIALGLVVILLTTGRMQDVGLIGEALLGFTLAVVASGVLLAIDTAGRNGLD